MSKYVDFDFCKLPITPREFNEIKFKTGDSEQQELYKKNKTPFIKDRLTYAQVMDEIKRPNYARFVPKGCCFIDYDNSEEAEEMKDIILHNKLKCLILKTQHGYHFLFRTPEFYEKEMTKATNWFGMKFDVKGTKLGDDRALPVQNIRVCGMERKEVASWGDIEEAIFPSRINIESLDVLPYWLWGKNSNKDLFKEGKTGESEYTLTDNPFTQLMIMSEGGRHDHIFSRCSYFACSNGFNLDEFKILIQTIHDQYLIEIGTPMSESDLFSDIDKRWEEYKTGLLSSGWSFHEEIREWLKVKKKADEKIDERRAAEYLYEQLDFYGRGRKSDGTFEGLLFKDIDGPYDYNNDVTIIRKKLRDYSDQNFKEKFLKEVEVQLMQMCAENKKTIKRSHQYVIAKNKILSCVTNEAYDFSWLCTRPPTDVILPWNWYSEEWVEEHKDDLGRTDKKFY